MKNQIVKKTTERGIIRPNKLKNTWEELDMVRSGLVNIDNLSIINHREEMNVKNYRRNLMKMFERNIPEIEIYYKKSMRSIIMDVPMTSEKDFMNSIDYRSRSKQVSKIIYNKTVCYRFKRNIDKLNTTEIEIYGKTSVLSLVIDVPDILV